MLGFVIFLKTHIVEGLAILAELWSDLEGPLSSDLLAADMSFSVIFSSGSILTFFGCSGLSLIASNMAEIWPFSSFLDMAELWLFSSLLES